MVLFPTYSGVWLVSISNLNFCNFNSKQRWHDFKLARQPRSYGRASDQETVFSSSFQWGSNLLACSFRIPHFSFPVIGFVWSSQGRIIAMRMYSSILCIKKDLFLTWLKGRFILSRICEIWEKRQRYVQYCSYSFKNCIYGFFPCVCKIWVRIISE